MELKFIWKAAGILDKIVRGRKPGPDDIGIKEQNVKKKKEKRSRLPKETDLRLRR